MSDSHLPFHAHAMPYFSRPQHSTTLSRRPCRGLEKNSMVGAWHGQDTASVNRTRPHCVNQMEKTHSKPLAARHGMGAVWERHAMCESAFTHLSTMPSNSLKCSLQFNAASSITIQIKCQNYSSQTATVMTKMPMTTVR